MFTVDRQFLVQIYFSGKTCTKFFLNACIIISFSISNIMLFLSMTIFVTNNCTHWSINMICSMLFSPLQHYIVQHISCPSTPEQNEVTKRKHRYIVETGFTTLFYAQLPKNLWIESFWLLYISSTNYLILYLGWTLHFKNSIRSIQIIHHLKVFGRRCLIFTWLVQEQFEPKF